MTDYLLELTFDASEAALEEVVQARLFLSGSSGNVSSDTTVTAWFESAEARDAAAELFRDLDVEIRAVERPRVDWLDRYQQSLQPIPIGRRFVVVPDAALLGGRDTRLSIIVPQEQAFGTGSHETTALCMSMLERIGVSGGRGLDIGAGSGILAIAMVLLGASKVIAFDNDLDAYGALRDNRIRNRISSETMSIFIGDTRSLRGGLFDVITMNIIPEVIVPLLGGVIRLLGDGGTLILSGILVARRGQVVAAAKECGLHVFREEEQGEWWCGAFRATRK